MYNVISERTNGYYKKANIDRSLLGSVVRRKFGFWWRDDLEKLLYRETGNRPQTTRTGLSLEESNRRKNKQSDGKGIWNTRQDNTRKKFCEISKPASK